MPNYPETEGFAFSFPHAELTLDGVIYTAISNVEIDQPTEEGVVMGTRSIPLKRTVGQMELGEGTLTFSDDAERLSFLKRLGPAYREKIWGLTWMLTAQGAESMKIECVGCRVTSNPFAHESGTDALGGDIGFSFMYHKVNGNAPHAGLP